MRVTLPWTKMVPQPTAALRKLSLDLDEQAQHLNQPGSSFIQRALALLLVIVSSLTYGYATHRRVTYPASALGTAAHMFGVDVMVLPAWIALTIIGGALMAVALLGRQAVLDAHTEQHMVWDGRTPKPRSVRKIGWRFIHALIPIIPQPSE